MITIRRSEERGHFDHGWLKTWHSFSFGDYRDAKHTRFGPLRVINEDIVAPGAGFPEHPHADMEILTWMLSGALAHRDSAGAGGHEGVIRPGDLQRMSAGSGVTHSEFNASKTAPAHLLQIWLFPEERGLAPSYEQKTFAAEGAGGKALTLLASREAREGSVRIHQDAELWLARLGDEGGAAREASVELRPGRKAWVQVAKGALEVNGVRLKQGDGARVEDETRLTLRAVDGKSEALVFDMA